MTMEYLWVVWVVIALAAILIEALTLGFAIICFAMGAFAAAVAAYFGVSIAWQLALFSLLSLLAFVVVRPLFIRSMGSKESVATNVNALIGRRGVVTQQILGGEGRVSIDGDDWKAQTLSSAETIEVGARVEIVGVESVILIVKTI